MQAFGQVAPIVVDAERTIIDGHALWQVLRDLGYDDVAVAVVSGRSDPKSALFGLRSNRLPQDAKWDDETLRGEFQALIDLSFDLDLTGFEYRKSIFSMKSMSRRRISLREEGLPPLQKPVSRIGDIWLCRKHRIGCCDALDASAVSAIVGEAKAAMVFSDPPYNVPIDGSVSGMGEPRTLSFSRRLAR